MMNLESLSRKGYENTEKEIKPFYNLLAKQYKTAMDGIDKEISDLYKKITKNKTAAQIAKEMKDNPAWYYTQAVKFDRLEKLKKRVQDLYIKASIKAGNMTVEASKTAITNNFYAQQFAVDFAVAKPLSFTVLNPKVVEASVLGGKVWDQIGKKYGKQTAYLPKYGTLSEIILKRRKADLVKIRDTITQGLIRGKGYGSVSNDIKKIMNTSANNALRIARTEITRNLNAGAYASHRIALSKGAPVRRKAVETLDSRTRQQSRFIDGQITDENDQFHYPGGLLVDIIGNSGVAGYDIHERGRSVEIIEGEEPDKRVGRNPLTGKNEIMSYKNYDEWMRSNGFKKNDTGRWVYKGLPAPKQKPKPEPKIEPKVEPKVEPKIEPELSEAEISLRDFVPAKTKEEAIERLSAYTYSSMTIRAEDHSIDALNSMLRGFDDTLGRYGVKLDKINYLNKRSKAYGMAETFWYEDKLAENESIVKLRLDYINNAKKYAKRDLRNGHNKYVDRKILFHRIRNGEIKSKYWSMEDADRILDDIENLETPLVCSKTDDPLYATVIHECHHILEKHFNINWRDEYVGLMKYHRSKVYGISEYATKNSGEGWAELGSAVWSGEKVDPLLLEIYRKLMKGEGGI